MKAGKMYGITQLNVRVHAILSKQPHFSSVEESTPGFQEAGGVSHTLPVIFCPLHR
jgi:hypothetical protein